MKKINLLIACLIVLVFSHCSKDLYPLKFNPQSGVSYKFTSKLTQVIAQEMMGQKVNMEQKMGFEYLFKIIDAPAGGDASIEVTYSRITLDVDNEMMKIHFDSDNIKPEDNDNAMVAVFSALKGVQYNMVVGQDGSVKKMEGLEKMISQMVESLGAVSKLSEAEIEEMHQTMKNEYSEEKLRNQMENTFRIFPPKDVGVGDKWTLNKKIDGIVPIDSETHYQLKSLDESFAIIDMESEFDTKEEVDIQGMKAKLKGKQSGFFKVDKESGFIMESTMDQEFSGNMEMMGMSIPLSIKSTMLMTSEKLK